MIVIYNNERNNSNKNLFLKNDFIVIIIFVYLEEVVIEKERSEK